MTISPAKTIAVVIGVERYAIGRSWDLDGPALDAARFTRWLVDRGVGPERIHLLAAPLPQNEEEFARLLETTGVRRRPADEATVREVFSRELPGASSDFLIVFAGGHGVLDDDARRVFYADATSTDKRNLDLTNLLRSMRSSVYDRHPRQLVLVDTCMTLVEEMGWRESLPENEFSVGKPVPERDQRALFSAGPGEPAINDDALKTGLFTAVALDELRRLPAESWPPDADGLRVAVQTHLTELRDAGRTTQIPAHVWYRSRTGEDGFVVLPRQSRDGPWPIAVGTIPPLASAFQERPTLQERIARTRAGGGLLLARVGDHGETGPPPPATGVLSGGGGTGKTQLAAWFAANASATATDLVIWINAAEVSGVISALASAADRIGLAAAEPEATDPHGHTAWVSVTQEQTARRMLEWLADTPRTWLVILDDISDPRIVLEWWPRSLRGTGWVIGTTRRRDAALSGGGRVLLPIDVFTPDESARYLTDRLGLTGPAAADDAVAELAEELGHLPLALSHAAAYMLDQQMSCATYLAEYRDVRSGLTEVMPASADADGYAVTGPRSAERTVATTWKLSIDIAMTERPAGTAAKAAALCAVLDPAGCPEELLATRAVMRFLGGLPPESEQSAGDADEPELKPAEARQAVALLHRFGLVTIDRKSVFRQIRMHALAQRATLESGMVEVEQALRAAADGLLELWESTSETSPVPANALRSNTRILLARRTAALDPETEFDLATNIGISLLEDKLYQQARQLFAELADAQQDGSDEFATAKYFLILAHEGCGDLARALSLNEELQNHPNMDEDELSTIRFLHARVLLSLGREADALAELDEVIPQFAGDPQRIDLYYQATAYAARCRAHDGKPEQSLADLDRLIGEATAGGRGGPGLLALQLERVHIMVDSRRSEEATAYLREVRRALVAAGNDTSTIATIDVELARNSARLASDHDSPKHPDTRPAQGADDDGESDPSAHDDSEESLRQAWQILTESLGEGHPQTMSARHQMVLFENYTAGPDQKVRNLQDLLADFVAVRGADFPETLTIRYEIGKAYEASGDKAEALSVYRAVHADRCRILGPDHPQSLAVKSALATMLDGVGEHQTALETYEELLAQRTRVHGSDHPDTLSSRYCVAYELSECGQHEVALAAHRATLADRARVLGPDHRDTLNSRYCVAYELGQCGQHEDALAAHRATLADRTRVLGPDHRDTLNSRNSIGFQLGRCGRHEEALTAHQALLADRARVLGADHPDTLNTRHQVGYELGDCGRHEEALTTHEAVLADRARALGADHPDTLNSRHQVAYELGECGRHEDALTAHQALLPDRARVLGPDHSDTLNTRHCIAHELGQSGRHEDSLAAHRAVLADRARALGPDHPDTLVSRSSLAHQLGECGQHEDALAAHRGLVADRTRLLGPDHPDTLISRHQVAYELGECGRHEDALAANRTLAADRGRVLGPDHPDTLNSRHQVAYELGECGQHEDALTAHRALLADRTRVLGPDHPTTLNSRSSVAYQLSQCGQHEDALAAHRALLADRSRVLGPDHQDTLNSRYSVAYELGECEEHEDALAAHQALLADRSRLLGPDHRDTLVSRHQVAYELGACGRHEDALAAYRAILTDRTRLHGPDHRDTLISRHSMAYELGECGQHEDALAAHQALLAHRTRLLGPDHPDTLISQYQVAYELGECGRHEDALAAHEALVAERIRVHGPDHPTTLNSRGSVAYELGQCGRHDDALAAYQALLADRTRVLGADHPTTLGLRLDLAAVQSRVGLHAEALAAYEDLLRLVGDRHSRARDLRGRIAAERRHQEDALQARIAELVAASGDHLIAELEAALDQARAIQTPKNAYRLQVPLLRAMLATGKYAPQSPPGADLLRELCRLHDRYGAAGPEVDRDLTLADRLVGH